MDITMAERLATRRRAAGYSQEALAAKLGVSRQAVSRWERGEASPDTDNLIALAALYGVTLDELLYAGPVEGGVGAADSVPDDDAPAGDASDAHDADDPQPRVNVSWREGIHVVDPQKGEEVHVGWDGIHVTDASKGDEVHVDRNGVNVHDTRGHSVVSDAEGDGVTIDGVHYESWKAAHDALGHDLEGKTDFERRWESFPFFAIVLLAYLGLGFAYGYWVEGLCLLPLAMAYPAAGKLIARRDLFGFLADVYPVCVTAWFLWQAVWYRQPHPAWAAFLTIPLVEWVLDWLRRR